MNTQPHTVLTTTELVTAVADANLRNILVGADLIDVPTFRLFPGQTLTGTAVGADSQPLLRFVAGADGLQLSANNQVQNLHLAADPNRCAVFNDTRVEQLGRLVLEALNITGVVRLLAAGQVRDGHVEAHHIHIAAADARGYPKRPKGYGVEVVPGAFMLWNQQDDAAVTITADLTGLSAGHPGAPVRGSGIFVSGAGDTGGRLLVSRLETGPVYSDGGIAPGTPDRISGGVFTVYGAFVDAVRNLGPVTTYGPNDMVLDNWGMVDRWTAEEKITSHGPSGIGFVNFGTIKLLHVNAPIETFGLGARGFNVYAGTVERAEFDRLVTHADGAVGIQISRPVGEIIVRRGIETHGGTGDSLVKGVLTPLAATPLSVKPGGSAHKVEIAGGLIAHGPGIVPLELHGTLETLQVTGKIAAAGAASTEIVLMSATHLKNSQEQLCYECR